MRTTLNDHRLIRSLRRSMQKGDKGVMTVNIMETRRNKGINKK